MLPLNAGATHETVSTCEQEVVQTLGPLQRCAQGTGAWWSGDQHPGRGQRPPAAHRPGFALEALEPRLLLSAGPIGTLVNGALSGALTSDSDAVVVEMTGVANDGGLIIDLTVNGTLETFGTSAVGVQSILLDGLAGNDTFRVANVLTKPVTIHGGADSDTLFGPDGTAAWTISGANAGSVGGNTLFDGIENISGRNGADQFTLLAAGSISGQIEGGNGVDTVIGPNTASSWTVSGSDAGMLNGGNQFAGIENITGGSGDDVITLQTTDAFSGPIDGGGGNDTLIGPDEDNVWTLSGANAGILNPDASNVGTGFVAIENLTGGSAGDDFKVGAAGSLTGLLDGGVLDAAAATINSLDFSGRGAAVSVNLETASATAVPSFARINSVVGSSLAGDTLTGPVALVDQTTWNVTGANSGVVEGTAFAGFENLTGQNSSSDAFIIAAGGSVSGTLDGGTGALDGFAVFDAGGNLTSVPAGGCRRDRQHHRVRQVGHLRRHGRLQPAERQCRQPRVHRLHLRSQHPARSCRRRADEGELHQPGVHQRRQQLHLRQPDRLADPHHRVRRRHDHRGVARSAFAGALMQYSPGLLTADLTANADTVVLGLASTVVSNDGGVIINLTVNGFLQSFGSAGDGVRSIVLERRERRGHVRAGPGAADQRVDRRRRRQ